MAEAVHFTEANFVLGPPEDFEDAVVPLPVQRQVDGKLVSCWRLLPAEIEEIVRTGKVWISVWGGLSQPPVFVTGHKHEVLAAET